MELSKRTLRQIKNMSNMFEFDTENKTAVIPLHYETTDDLLDTHLSSPKKPVLSDDTIDYLREKIACIPKEFTVEFALTIDDYGEYSHEALMQTMKSMIENKFYYHDENRKKDNVLSVALLIVGILILAFQAVGSFAGWYGPEGSIIDTVIETILDVLVWVFVWEGAYILLLTYESDSTLFSHCMQRFSGFRFLNKEGKVLCSLDRKQLYDGWIHLGKREVLARNYILFSNALMLAILTVISVEFLAGIGIAENLQTVYFAISWILIVLLVISNISFYKESGSMKKSALPLSVVSSLYSVFRLIESIITNASTNAVIGHAVLSVALIINIVCIIYMKKQSVKTN